MPDVLRVRVYNVRFGDAILISAPDLDEKGMARTLHILIDIGNALAREGGRDDVFKPIFDDILAVLGGAPLDLYVMTHEHMDHVQGLMYAAAKLGVTLKAREVWMSASSGPGYYERFDKAKKQKLAALSAYQDVARFFAARPAASMPATIASLLALNDPRTSKDCVDHIAKIGLTEPLYVHREIDLEGRNPFRRAKVRLLAPEEDTSVYYGQLRPKSLNELGVEDPEVAAISNDLAPPEGVSPTDFADLVKFRVGGMGGSLLQIDKAANNSSVVIELEWEGWILMLPGDAEEKSWKILARENDLRPVHFLKVSHHGSINGTPEEVFEQVLPLEPSDDRPRFAVVSTFDGSYPGVPNAETLTALAKRASLHDTRSLPPGGYFDFEFEASTGVARCLPSS